jgi:MurNAc alpha-1-phosphate uridylyltransferase
VHTIEKLVDAGFRSLVINLSWRGDQIATALGDGSRWGVAIRYSVEADGALGTGGGIRHALPLLGEEPFLVINADIWTDFPLRTLRDRAVDRAHLVLVDNPPHHPEGDFTLRAARVGVDEGVKLTFSGLGVYRPALFSGCGGGIFELAFVLRAAAARGAVSGEHYRGKWYDVGTPDRLAAIDRHLRARAHQ